MATFTSTAPIHTTCPAPARLSVVATLIRAAALWRSRRALAKLSDAQLEDIGLSAAEAADEANRPFWDAPAHWLR